MGFNCCPGDWDILFLAPEGWRGAADARDNWYSRPWAAWTSLLCSVSHSVISDSLRLQGPQPARFLCPWDSPARIMEWVAMPFSRGSSWPRDQTQLSCISGRFFTIWASTKTTSVYPWKKIFIVRCFTLPRFMHSYLALSAVILHGFLGEIPRLCKKNMR